MIPIEEWKRLQMASLPGLKELLLSAEARFELTIPSRGKLRHRPGQIE
jgi:antitoxin Phd